MVTRWYPRASATTGAGISQNVLSDCGGAAGGGGDAEVVEEGRKDVGVYRLSGSTAGEQPPGSVVGRGVHVVPAVDPAEQEFRERTSRYTAIVALPDGIKAEQVAPYLTRSLLGVPSQLRRTLTRDRGREMAEHQAITAETGMPIHLCKPRSPWQRGTNENTNRLLRQYLPKGSDLRTFSQADLDTIAHELNHRPRKTHGYRTPAEVYAALLNSGDALTA